MTITIMYNPVTGRYTLTMLYEEKRATLDTLYLNQIANMINLLRPAYQVRLVFHVSVDDIKREELKQLIKELMAV